MTELLIGGYRVVLPPDFSLKFTEENPFFTKRGKYTLDLNLSLQHPVNAKIYGHCDRANKSGDVPTGRSAILIVDGKVYLKGIEVYLSHTNTEVSIQLISGNSELNYIIGEDRSVRDLNLGSAILEPWPPLSDSQFAIDPSILDLDESYPARDWQLLPFMTNDSDYLIGNSYHYLSLPSNWMPKGDFVLKFSGVRDLRTSPHDNRNRRPQPYLCAIIDKVFQSLGYELLENAIAEHSIYKHIYIVHGFDTLDYAKMMPDWTVAEFLYQLELFFDCTVVVDANKKNVRILSNSMPLEQTETQLLTVSDNFKTESGEDVEFTREEKNIGYSLGSEEYYALGKLPAAVKKIATMVGSTIGEIPDLIAAADANKLKCIFRDNETNTDFIAYNSNGTLLAKRVDSFKDLLNNPEKSEGLDIEIKIIPAPFKALKRTIDIVYANCPSVQYHMQFPMVENYDPLVTQRAADNEDDFSIQDLATGSDTIESQSLNTKLRVALFMGRQYVDTVGAPNLETREKIENFPICFVEDYPDYYNASTYSRQFLTGQHPFRFDWISENIYQKSTRINADSLKVFEIQSAWPFDIKSKFVIKNRLYLCSKVEVNIDIDGVKSLPVGYFYLIEQ